MMTLKSRLLKLQSEALSLDTAGFKPTVKVGDISLALKCPLTLTLSQSLALVMAKNHCSFSVPTVLSFPCHQMDHRQNVRHFFLFYSGPPAPGFIYSQLMNILVWVNYENSQKDLCTDYTNICCHLP